ncbi:hypothetical protein VTO42DRAFT_2151 [Malbranchea cinnamomea]
MASRTAMEDLKKEIERLKEQLHSVQSSAPDTDPIKTPDTEVSDSSITSMPQEKPDFSSAFLVSHPLLLLADSALPLGSFAYSSGLESFLAHTKTQPTHTCLSTATTDSFYKFLALSISSLASTTLPYLLKAHRCPSILGELDNDLDASTPCTVARRASVAQGLALLSVWERAYRTSYTTSSSLGEASSAAEAATAALDAFSNSLKQDPDDAEFGCGANGHLAPLWGVVCVAMGVALEQAAYVFMLNHAKAVLSAAVRASVMGPYQAQAVLASKNLQTLITQKLQDEWETEPGDAGQNVPVLDLWVGRHELLYSRIFNS